jgi:uncharacterized protein YlxW (UPF0749 family)
VGQVSVVKVDAVVRAREVVVVREEWAVDVAVVFPAELVEEDLD